MVFLLLLLSQDLPDGPGKDMVLKLCQDCHDTAVVTADNRTKDGWQKTIDKMIERGADGTDAQFEAVVTYLTKNFGRINVNKATAAEIAAGVGFTDAEAAEIVKYREKNGDFKDWREVGKAVDPAKVEARKNHIAVK